MSFKVFVTLMLLRCLGTTGTPFGVTEEPPQEGGAITLPPSMTITDVRWFKNEASTTVQVCVEGELPLGMPKLSYDDGVNTTVAEGVIDTPDPNCATFTKNASFTFTAMPARYELTVTNIAHPGVFSERAVSTFAITVRSTLLICGDSLITKVTWSGNETLSDFQCIPSTSDSDKACYLDSDITGTELCFVVTDAKGQDVNVCLNGPVDNNPHSKGSISSNYFYYGPEPVSNEARDATLSLDMILVPANMRAIVREAGATTLANVYDCSNTDCTFPAHERKLATYEVCLDAMDDSLTTLKTVTTKFTDLNLNAFDGGFQKSMLLECVFANGLPGMKYTARLLDKLPEAGGDVRLATNNIDCTGVSPDHACFGYLDTDLVSVTVYVAVSAADADYTNTIIVPYTIP